MQYLKSIIFLLIISCSTVYSQSTFERLYTDDIFDFIGLDIAHVPGGTYYMLSAVKHNDSTDFNAVNITMLGKKGDYKQSVDIFIADSLKVFPEGSIATTKNGLAVSFTTNEEGKESHVFLNIDYNLREILWSNATGSTTIANIANERNVIDYNPVNDNLIHFGSHMMDNGDPDIYVNHYSSFGANLKSIRYNHPLDASSGKMYVEQIGGTQWTRHDDAYVFCGMVDTLESDFFVTKLNSENDVEWTYSYGLDTLNHRKGNAIDIIQLNDTVYVAAFNQITNSGKSEGYLIGIDSLGIELWTKRISYASYDCKITELAKTGSDIVFAIKRIDTLGFGKVIMAGFDMNGELSWQKAFKDASDTPYTEGELIKTSNNKFAYLTTGYDTDIVGFIKEHPLRYLMVTDLDGSTICNTDTVGLIVDSIGVFQESFTWEESNDIVIVDKIVEKSFRAVIPYSASPVDGKTLFCPSDMINSLLKGTAEGAVSYKWGTGETTDTLRVFDIGQYPIEVTIEDKYCHSYCDTITLDYFEKPTANIGLDYESWCSDQLLGLNFVGNVPAGIKELEWSTGEVEMRIEVIEFGAYSVTVTDECDEVAMTTISIDSTSVPTLQEIEIVTVDIEGGSCENGGEVFLIFKNYSSFNSFEWSTGETTDTIIVVPGEYSVSVQDYCEEMKSKSITVRPPENCAGPLQFPSAFVPLENDEDFLLDRFFAPVNKTETEITTYHLVVANRWGQVIFESDDYTKGWNGRYKDKLAISGTYFFKAVYSTEIESYEEKGGFELVK